MKRANGGSDIQGRALLLLVGTVVITLGGTLAVLYATGMLVPLSRQAEVAARGAEVMPFDLNKTQHIFKTLPDGGLQTVVARDASDVQQITLIRQHLREEATRFRAGDFADPARIHGTAMPGLHALRGSTGQIEVIYSELQTVGRFAISLVMPLWSQHSITGLRLSFLIMGIMRPNRASNPRCRHSAERRKKCRDIGVRYTSSRST